MYVSMYVSMYASMYVSMYVHNVHTSNKNQSNVRTVCRVHNTVTVHSQYSQRLPSARTVVDSKGPLPQASPPSF